MSKAFTRETETDDEPEGEPPDAAPVAKNYITPQGYARLRAELREERVPAHREARPRAIPRSSCDGREADELEIVEIARDRIVLRSQLLRGREDLQARSRRGRDGISAGRSR